MRSSTVARRFVRFAEVGLAVVLATGVLAGCLSPREVPWSEGIPESEWQSALADLPEEAQTALKPLSEVFYGRITSRRFNSRATFEDPSVRQFFPSVAAYSDYYAALVDDLDQAFIEFNRPTVVELLGVERNDSGTLQIKVRFTGENDLPLRWWTASLEREDEWVWREGRWWVVPGKV